jgi:hypothetical protein
MAAVLKPFHTPPAPLRSFLLVPAIVSFLTAALTAQTVYVVQYASQADVRLYETTIKSQADVILYRVPYRSQADPEKGLWHEATYRSQADLAVYWVAYRSQADCVVYFAPYRSQARRNACFRPRKP